jgi:hypothetical protein
MSGNSAWQRRSCVKAELQHQLATVKTKRSNKLSATLCTIGDDKAKLHHI